MGILESDLQYLEPVSPLAVGRLKVWDLVREMLLFLGTDVARASYSATGTLQYRVKDESIMRFDLWLF
jgi:hypothetical protein